MTSGTAVKRVVVLGALSAIAEATLRLYAEEGACLALVGRDAERLETVAKDLRERGARQCLVWTCDLAQGPSSDASLAAIASALGEPIDACILVYGVLGDQKVAERDLDAAREIMVVNYLSAALWALDAANLLEAQDHGALVVVGSVAGDRGRGSNFIYGSAKGAIALLANGLAHRLAGTGASVTVVKPGLVDTPMTAHMPKSGPLWAKPGQIAQTVKAAADRNRSGTVYSPWFWSIVMLCIRSIPSSILHRTKL